MSADTSSMLSGSSSTIILIVLLVAMFAIMIIPQRRREKKVKKMLDEIKVGDRVRTIGGFYGRIVQLKPDVVVIECGPEKTKLTIARAAISTVESADVENDTAVEVKE